MEPRPSSDRDKSHLALDRDHERVYKKRGDARAALLLCQLINLLLFDVPDARRRRSFVRSLLVCVAGQFFGKIL